MKARQDAWTKENDLELAETVLRHIREGSTQVAAFTEASKKLNRTPGACGYRWNAEVRKNFDQAIVLAKKQCKEMKDKNVKAEKAQKTKQDILLNQSGYSITIDDCIAFLSEMNENPVFDIAEENKVLEQENKKLLETYEDLKNKYNNLEKKKLDIEKEYRFLIMMIDRAEKNKTEQYNPIH